MTDLALTVARDDGEVELKVDDADGDDGGDAGSVGVGGIGSSDGGRRSESRNFMSGAGVRAAGGAASAVPPTNVQTCAICLDELYQRPVEAVAAADETGQAAAGRRGRPAPVIVPPTGRGDIRELPCRHLFHASCIDRWLEQKATCPLCKGDIMGALFEMVYPDSPKLPDE